MEALPAKHAKVRESKQILADPFSKFYAALACFKRFYAGIRGGVAAVLRRRTRNAQYAPAPRQIAAGLPLQKLNHWGFMRAEAFSRGLFLDLPLFNSFSASALCGFLRVTGKGVIKRYKALESVGLHAIRTTKHVLNCQRTGAPPHRKRQHCGIPRVARKTVLAEDRRTVLFTVKKFVRK
jgi:hypothetical protein